MSLGDYLRYLRAKHGGESTLEIAKVLGLPSPWPINEIEQRYREVGTDELVQKLAAYYGVPGEELLARRKRSRKALSQYLEDAQKANRKAMLLLRNGERLAGMVLWADMGAFALDLGDGSGPVIVERHIVDDWK
jgi:transcriptional regulator with XRE-family HTH domain